MNRLSAAGIAFTFVVANAIWVALTDWLFEPIQPTWLASVKDAGFVSFVALQIYIYASRQIRHQNDVERALRSAVESKNRLIATVGHDLRQPLQSISLFAGLIAAGNLPPLSRSALDKLNSSVDGMGQLLDKILSLAKMDLGLAAEGRALLEVNHIINSVVDEMRPQAEGKGLTLKGVPTSAVVMGDVVGLTMILRNLVANATKYTARGKVLVGCLHRHGELLICVYDTGIGIADDQLKLIFDEFYQVNNPSQDSRQGIGLGLAIVERLTRTLGYRIIVRSTVGKGTAFCVVAPLINRNSRH